MTAKTRQRIEAARVRAEEKAARAVKRREYVAASHSDYCAACGAEKVIGETGMRFCLFCKIKGRNPALAQKARERDKRGLARLNEPIKPGEFGYNADQTMTGCTLADWSNIHHRGYESNASPDLFAVNGFARCASIRPDLKSNILSGRYTPSIPEQPANGRSVQR